MNVRHAGINVPLFSLRSQRGWGIGELADIVPFTAWMADAGFDRLMLLPLGTMPHGQTSPYSAVSTMAIDPMYITMREVPDFERAGGVEALSADGREAIESARLADIVWYDMVRRAKHEALLLAFRAFMDDEWGQLTTRASTFAAYVARERAWLDDYALFMALSEANGRLGWRDWAPALAAREPRAVDDARRQFKQDVLFHQYTQWLAETQWQASRNAARARGVAMFGDLPFVAGTDSPEVWARTGEFRLDVSTGVPPDAFSATGQDWGLPTYRWDVITAGGYVWLQQRARRMAALFDGLRVDHAVGLFRTYGRPRSGEAFFTPAEEPAQLAQGVAVMQLLRASGLALIAEDLGVIPDFVRAALAELGIPGCKVVRWERDWQSEGAPFVPPAFYTPLSAAMTGTHDTESMSVWWNTTTEEERAAVLKILGPAEGRSDDPGQPWSDALRDDFLRLVYACGSRELFLPVQDAFGWGDRINVPGTVGPHNWTWCLPWNVDRWHEVAETRERALFFRALARQSGRGTTA